MDIDAYATDPPGAPENPQPGAWARRDRPGPAGGNPWRWSMHWNPGAGYPSPEYHRALPPPDLANPDEVNRHDLSGRQHLNLWVGLGNSRGQWRGGNLTFRFTLADADSNRLAFGGTFWLPSSDNYDKPIFTRISVPIPQAEPIGLLADYRIEVPNFTAAAKMGDLYLHLLGMAPAAEAWPPDHPGVAIASPRAAVYSLKCAGTARTPMSVYVQSPTGIYSRTATWVNTAPDGTAGITDRPIEWQGPPDNPDGSPGFTAPDGTPHAVQARVWGGGAASGSILNQTRLTGGGGAGGCAGDDHYPVDPGELIQGVVARGGNPSIALGSQPGHRGGTSIWGAGRQPYALTATGGDSPPTNTSQNAAPGEGLAPAPIRYAGGWSGVPVYPGQGQGQGAGGGGGGGGANGPGGWGGGHTQPGNPWPYYGQAGGVGGDGGGGHGGGGRQSNANGAGNPGQGPAGGAGGATRITNGTQLGSKGAGGKITVAWIAEEAKIHALLLHMPNPDAEATFVPVVNVGDGAIPPDGGPDSTFPVLSPHPGVPVRYDGTYAIALTAAAWGGPGVNADRTLTVRIRQVSLSNTADTWTTTLTRTLNPNANWVTGRGLIPMGNATLPVRWIPPDNDDTRYEVVIQSSNAGDRFLDCLILDVTGQTVGLIDPRGPAGDAGYATWYVDEPHPGQGLGALLGSPYGRTSARSVTDMLAAASGGPFMLEPGTENLMMVYTVDRFGSPGNEQWEPLALGADYYPRWWFDRGDDRSVAGETPDEPPAGPGRAYIPPAGAWTITADDLPGGYR